MDRPIFSFIAGGLAVLGGILALANPLAATLAAEQLAGWFFVVIGLLQFISAFQREGWGGKILMLILGALYIFVGVSLIGNPLAGTLSLTWLVAFLFLFGGVVKIAMSVLYGLKEFWLLLLSGVVSIILAFMIFSNFPFSAISALGILLGVELIMNGIALIAFGFTRRPEPA
jgi:uncharacterized membrane protein HdeD (DUF308 family)